MKKKKKDPPLVALGRRDEEIAGCYGQSAGAADAGDSALDQRGVAIVEEAANLVAAELARMTKKRPHQIALDTKNEYQPAGLSYTSGGDGDERRLIVPMQATDAPRDAAIEATMVAAAIGHAAGAQVNTATIARFVVAACPGLADYMAPVIAKSLEDDPLFPGMIGAPDGMPEPGPADEGDQQGEAAGGAEGYRRVDKSGKKKKKDKYTADGSGYEGARELADREAAEELLTKKVGIDGTGYYGYGVAIHQIKDATTARNRDERKAGFERAAAQVARRIGAATWIAPESGDMYGMTSGELDEPKLATPREDRARAFMRRDIEGKDRPAIAILLDESGSMGQGPASPCASAAIFAAALAECLEISGADIALYGHTTASGAIVGCSGRKTIIGGGVGDCRVIVKEYANRESLLAYAAGTGGNIDGVAILAAYDRLKVRYPNAPRYGLVLLADGGAAGVGMKPRRISRKVWNQTFALARAASLAYVVRKQDVDESELSASNFDYDSTIDAGIVGTRAAFETIKAEGGCALGIGFGNFNPKHGAQQWGTRSQLYARSAGELPQLARKTAAALYGLMSRTS